MESKKERISTTVSKELSAEARKRGIRFSYALSCGLRRLLNDEAPGSETSQAEKVRKLAERLSEVSARMFRAEEELLKLKK